MSAPPELKTSKVRPWLRFLAWILPGICAPGVLLGWLAISYGSGSRLGGLSIVPLGIGFILLTLTCAFFDAKLTLPTPPGDPRAPSATLARPMTIFCLLQLLVIPAVGSIIFFGCVTVINVGI